MENRKNLHDYGLVLIILGVLHFFMYVSTIISSIVSGEMAAEFAKQNAGLAVKIVTGVVFAILAFIVLADVIIGIKALKVSKNPTADKGHIVAAKVFFVLSVIAAVAALISIFGATKDTIIDCILNLSSSTLGACVYVIFIKAATAVRKDVLNGETK